MAEILLICLIVTLLLVVVLGVALFLVVQRQREREQFFGQATSWTRLPTGVVFRVAYQKPEWPECVLIETLCNPSTGFFIYLPKEYENKFLVGKTILRYGTKKNPKLKIENREDWP